MPVRLNETYSPTAPVTCRDALYVSLACRGRYPTEAVRTASRQATTLQWPVGLALPSESVLISDGGLATELEARGHDLSDPLWSARLLADAPQEIVAVHAAYFRAGATIATTASYQASFDGLCGPRNRPTTKPSGCCAAASNSPRPRGTRPALVTLWVAASVGPYGAALADGSEYRGRYGLSVAALTRWHRPRLEILAAAGADVLALETVPDVDEAEALVDLVRSVGVPAWLSYTIDGTRTRAGQPLADAFAVAAGVDEIVAVGVNCCAPDDVLPAIGVAQISASR